MLDLTKALELQRAHLIQNRMAEQNIDYKETLNQSLDEDIIAERDYPPFNRVMMDGVSFKFNSIDSLPVLEVSGEAKAGSPQLVADESSAIEVMTGAPLPLGHDSVVPYEEVSIEEGQVYFNNPASIRMGQNIHAIGSDFKQGDILLSSGSEVKAPQLGIIVSQGISEFKIRGNFKIAFVSTGDEIVSLEETPLDYQIRRSNPEAASQLLNDFGYSNISKYHLRDDKSEMFEKLTDILAEYDLVILSGGVSMGKYDFVPTILSDLKVDRIFHKVKQRPGKPLWFGKKQKGPAIFGLPGNPVSSLISLRRHVIEYLNQSSGVKSRPIFAKVDFDLKFEKDMTYFVPVKVEFNERGEIIASAIKGNGSGDYGHLASSDGFIELPAQRDEFFKGESYPLFLWRKL